MATRQELETELQKAYSQLKAADSAGAYDDAKKLQTYARQLEGDLGYDYDRPEPEPAAELPALQSREEIDEVEKAIDTDDPSPTAADYGKSVVGAFAEMGGDFMSGFERRHKQTQYEKIEQLRSFQDSDDPKAKENIARLEKEVEAGKQVDPTFYGTFIRPWAKNETQDAANKAYAYAEEVNKSRTDVAQTKAAKPFFAGNPQTYVATDPSTWFDDTSMPWEDLDGFLMKVAGNAPQLGASIISARLGGKGGAMLKGRQLRSQGITNPEVVRKQAAKFGGATGTATGSGTEYVLVRDNVAAGMDKAFEKQWDNEELWEANDRYNELTDAGFSDEMAKQAVSNEIANAAGNTAGLVSAGLGMPMNRFFAKVGLEQAASRAGSALKGGVGETIQEGLQETSEQFVSNMYEKGFDPTKPLTEGLAEAFFGGAAIGGPIGAAGGALSGGDATQVAFNKDQKEVEKKGFKDWRKAANKRLKLGTKMGDPLYIEETPADERIRDFEEFENLQNEEAQNYLRAERKIRQMQEKYGAGPEERKRTDIFSARYKAAVKNIETARTKRRGADDRISTEQQLIRERDEILRQVDEDAGMLSDLERTQGDLAAIAEGERIEEDRYEPLVEQKYGRWTNKAQDKFVLTPAGRAHRDALAPAIEQARDKLESGYGGEERRQGDPGKRKRLEDMTEEERMAELSVDSLTNLQNKRAKDDIERDEGPAKAYAYVDADSLKWVNDNMGHEKGNQFLRKIAKAMRGSAAEDGAYRVGGDEFVFRGESEEELEDALQKIAAKLEAYDPIKDDMGRTVKPSITWATGTNESQADERMLKMKQQRTHEKKRAEREAPPASLLLPGQIEQKQKQLPLLSYDSSGVTEQTRLVEEISRIRDNRDEFSQRRYRNLKAQLIAIRSTEENAELAEMAWQMSESLMDTQMTDSALASQWNGLPEDIKAGYETKASEFYTKIAGEYISPMEAYKFEHGSNKLVKNLPQPMRDANGNKVSYENSEEFQTLDRLLKEGQLPTDVVKWANDESARLKSRGMTIASPTHALGLRVSSYIGGEMHLRGPSPFSGNTEEFDRIHKGYTEGILPLMHLATDPIMDANFYRDVKKGDPIEIIMNGKSVFATVVVDNYSSITVRWDDDDDLFDPDTRESGKSAKFSRGYGWQVSNRMSQGGMPHNAQSGSWPGQARLGRRLNGLNNKWETAGAAFNRKLKKTAGENRALKGVHPTLRDAARERTTKKNMRRARSVADNLFRDYRNMPKITIVNSISEMPKHMQEVLVNHGVSGHGVQGMFDEVNPRNGVWVFAGNVAAKAQQENKSIEKLIAEVLMHETVGHYGMRGMLGTQELRDSYMDAIAKSFPKEVMAKGREYRLVQYRPGTSGKADWISGEHRRLAAEEWFAEVVQNEDLVKLTPPQQSLIQRILNSIRTWMAEHGLGKYAIGPLAWSDNDIKVMVSNAQRFVQSGNGFKYVMKNGETTSFMRDADIFYASILNEFHNGMRDTNGQERQQMKKNGLVEQRQVRTFPAVSTKKGYAAIFEKLAKDNKVKQIELDFTGVVSFLENMTARDVVHWGGKELLPPHIKNQYDELNDIANFDDVLHKNKMLAKERELTHLLKIQKQVDADQYAYDPGIKKDIDELNDWLNRAYTEIPDTSDKDKAAKDLDVMLEQPLSKKTKISRDILSFYLAGNAPRIRVRPYGEYQRTRQEMDETVNPDDRGPDITPETWPYQRPVSNPHVGYTPVGTNREKYGVNVIQSESPAIQEPSHFSFPGEFMHWRYSEAVIVDGDKPAYAFLELQSDAYEKKANAAVNRDDFLNRKREAENSQRLISASSHVPLDLITQDLVDTFLEVRSQTPWVNELEPTDTEYLLRSSDTREAVNQKRDRLQRSRSLMQEELRAFDPYNMYKDDARAFDYLDLLALQDVSSHVMSALDNARDRYSTESVSDENFRKEISDHVTRMTIDENKPLARLIGKKSLFNRFMKEIIGPVVGKEYSQDEIDGVRSRTAGATATHTATINPQLSEWFEDNLGSAYLSNFLTMNNSELRALGWNPDAITIKRMAEGSIHLTAPQIVSPEVSFEDTLNSLWANQINQIIGQRWSETEDNRIRDVRMEIRTIERRTEGTVNSLSEAKQEIDFGEDNGWWPSETRDLMHMDSERYAEMKTDREIESINDRSNAWEDYIDDISEIDYDGQPLSRDHSDYRDLIQVDDDGDADTEEAEEWLQGKIDDAFSDMLETGGSVYTSIYEQFEEEFNDKYEDTVEETFMVPISWAYGVPNKWRKGYLIAYTEHEHEYDVDETWRFGWDDESRPHDYFYDRDESEAGIIAMILEYYKEDGIRPPATSQFSLELSDAVPQSLRDDLVRRDAPSQADLSQLESNPITGTVGEPVNDLEKSWEHAVSRDKIDNNGYMEKDTPWRKHWRIVGLKASLADAVRKGYTDMIWHPGDANASRGGWGSADHSEWKRNEYIDWSVKTMNLQGRDQPVYTIRMPDNKTLLLTPDRMGQIIGYDVAKELTRRASGDNPERSQKYLEDNFTIVPSRQDQFILFDRASQKAEHFTTNEEAQARRAERMNEGLEEGVTAAGRLTQEDMGGLINIALSGTVPDYYQDTLASGGYAKGAREAYDVITIQEWSKYLKNFGAKITESSVKIGEGEIREAVYKDGARVNYQVNEQFMEDYPNLRIDQVSPEGFIVISDKGLIYDNVYSRHDAQTKLQIMLDGARAHNEGLRVNRIEFTPELIEYFGAGNLPVLSQQGGYPWKVSRAGEGDLYIQRVGPNAGTVYRTRQGPNDLAVKLDQTKLLPDYAFYLLQRLQPKLNARSKGTAQQFISASDVSEVMVEHFQSQDQLPLMSLGKGHSNPGALKTAMDKIGSVPRKLTIGQRFDAFKKSWKGELEQGLFDKFYGIKNALNEAGWKGEAENNPYIMARLSTSLESQMRAVMEYGHPVWKDGIMQTEGKGLMDILAPVGDPDMLKKWSAYMVGKRAKRLKEEGREQLFSDEEIEAMIEVGEESQIFEQVAQEYAEFNKKVLDFAEEAGTIDPDTRALWEHADYVPFYRVADDRLIGPLSAGRGISDQRSPIRKLKGGEQNLADIPNNIIQNIATLIDGANKNNAAVLAVDALKGTGIMNKVSNVQTTTALVPMGQVKAKLIQAGMNPNEIPPEALTGLQKMFAVEPAAGEGVITVMRKGKRETYRTDDMLLYNAMTQINAKQWGRWMNFFRAPKRTLTTLVTLDPGFMIRNYLRDLGASYVLSRDVNNPATHIARSLQGWKQALEKSDSLKTMMSAGAAFDAGYISHGDPLAGTKIVQKAARQRGFNKSVRGKILDSPRKLFDAYKEIGTSVENANRIAVYNEAIANGKSKAQAAFESKDLMDFSMAGSWGAVQFLIQSVPFMGARLQGMHRMGRGFTEHPVAFTMKGTLIGLAGMALYLKYADDERYKRLETWDKQAYYHFWIGDEHYRLPKPFEVGAIFNTIPEIMWEYAHSDANDAERTLMKQFGHMLGETFALNPLGVQAFAPVVENAFNYSFFTGRQIVSPYEEKNLPPEQFRPSTSPTFVQLARALPEGLDKVNKKYRSPLYLQNLYAGYSGTIGRYFMMGSDAMVRTWSDDFPARPTMSPAEMPVWGSFARGTEGKDIRRTKYEESFYNQIREVTEIQGSIRRLERFEMFDRAEMIEDSKEGQISTARELENARRQVSELNKDSMLIWFDEDMDPDEKYRQIQENSAEKNLIYKDMYDQRPSEVEQEVTEDDVTFLIEEFGVDQTISRIEEKHPATAGLMRTIGDDLTDEQVSTLLRAGGGQ